MNIAEKVPSDLRPEQIGIVDLENQIRSEWRFKEIVGRSAALQSALLQIDVVASNDCTVLITGETGTGKERFARAIHEQSRRSGRAFIGVNCGVLAPSLVSSELFGHERGAFTGAVQRRLGRFELAHSGTIFLDEVGELSAETQVALLRVLQEREFERVGGTQSVRVDVRVIAATNRDLETEVAKGNFRPDLYYRLNVFPIVVPPLRERKEDIRMLAEYFLKQYAKRAGKNVRSIDNRALQLFQSYDWPGNVRELQNVIERSVILSSNEILSVNESWLFKKAQPPAVRAESCAPSMAVNPQAEKQLGNIPAETTSGASCQSCGGATNFESAGDTTLRASERALILRTLNSTGWIVGGRKGAAVQLGMKRTTLLHRMKKHGLHRPDQHGTAGGTFRVPEHAESIGFENRI
jgi:transcriptional regulator with GAF, ATPase, and Fis domain